MSEEGGEWAPASLAELAEQRERHPDLAELFDFQVELLRVQSAAETPLGEIDYDPSRAKASLERGVPLLKEIGMEIDDASLPLIWEGVCSLALKWQLGTPEEIGAIESLIEEPGRLRSLAEGYLDNTPGLDLNRELLLLILKESLRPLLQRYALALRPLLDEGAWREGRCPICGGEPDLAYLQEETGARSLICSRCDTEWPFPRLRCPFCGNDDHEDLAYFLGEEETFRLYVCERCRHYLKTVDLRRTAERLSPITWRIRTAGMDLSAVREGFQPSP